MSAEHPAGGAAPAALDRIGLMHLLVVVLIGSTSFLAIRVAVGPEGGFPPLTMGALRCAVAAGVLGAWIRLFMPAIAVRWRAVVGVLASGAVLWGGGNGLAAVASQRVGSGTVALFFATAPLWVTVLDSLLRRQAPARRDVLAMGLGTAGLTVLSAPAAGALPRDPWLLLALLGAPLFFAIGIVTLRRTAGTLGGLRAAAMQMAAGAAVLGTLAWVMGERLPAPTWVGWTMWGWLTLVGSVFGFPSFAIALSRLPTTVFMSHAWINPILATGIGVVVAGEGLSPTALAAAGLVLAGLWLAVGGRSRAR